jgi:hypothetical protein
MMNEKKYVESVISSGKIDQKHVARDLYLMVKYCYLELGMRRSKIIAYVDEFMYKHYTNYNPFNWHSLIEKYVRKCSGRHLIQIDGIGITQNELDIIEKCGDVETQKLLFTMLVIAKYKLVVYSANGWVSENRDEVFRTANSKIKVIDRNMTIHNLYKGGYLELSKSNKKENWRIPFIDTTSESVCTVTSTIDCGLRYMQIKHLSQVLNCKDCGKLFISSNNNMFRCRECQKNQRKLDVIKAKLKMKKRAENNQLPNK